jgi:hypothetical protein
MELIVDAVKHLNPEVIFQFFQQMTDWVKNKSSAAFVSEPTFGIVATSLVVLLRSYLGK